MATYMGSYVGPTSPYPTIVPFPGFHAEADVMALRNAIKGVGTDEETIITILANRSSSQRQEITQQYKLIVGSDLIADLRGDLNGNFEETALALMEPPAIYDANQLYKAMKGAGTDEDALIEILSSRSNEEIRAINEVYLQQYKRRLDEDITGDTGGALRKLLVSLSTGQRSEKVEVDEAKARKEAEELHNAGEKRWGTEESVFLKVLASRSHAQLRATFAAYSEIAHRSIVNSLEREMSGHIRKAYVSVVKCIQNPAEYFADELYTSMKGAGTDNKKLIRIIVSRAEIDLGNIKMEFLSKYNKALHIMVYGDTSGDYRDMLLSIIKP